MTNIKTRLGYCCINNTLRNSDPEVYSSRSITAAKFNLELASERGLNNVYDILKILKWNEEHDIRVFRIGSEPLPRSGDFKVGYKIDDLKDSKEIRDVLAEIGKYAKTHSHSLSFHPGQYVCLGSPRHNVIDLGIKALEAENEVADAICRDVSLDIPINIHVGGSYNGDFENTSNRFIDSFSKLSPNLKSRLTLENDDKKSCWSIRRLYDMIYKKTAVPICADLHHWLFCNETDGKNDLESMEKDFDLAYETWRDRSMQIHYSQSPTKEKLIPAHSDMYRDPIPNFVEKYENSHIHLECKNKEIALLDYRKNF
jgi:UV DNA damage endonuclease